MSDGRMKFNYENSFTNKQYHELSGQTISVPPTQIGQTTWSQDIPEQLKKHVLRVVEHVYGPNAEGLTVESYRMCWYVRTAHLCTLTKTERWTGMPSHQIKTSSSSLILLYLAPPHATKHTVHTRTHTLPLSLSPPDFICIHSHPSPAVCNPPNQSKSTSPSSRSQPS